MKKKKESRTSGNTRKIALAGIMCALCFVIMYIGAVTGIFDLCAVIFSATVIIIGVIEIGGIYPWLIWVVTGTLCMMLLPDKYIALEFILFGGVYPMLKSLFERLGTVLAWAVKLIYFIAAFSASVYIAKYILNIGDIGFKMGPAAVIIACAFFIMADICFTLMISLYIQKLRPKIKRGKK